MAEKKAKKPLRAALRKLKHAARGVRRKLKGKPGKSPPQTKLRKPTALSTSARGATKVRPAPAQDDVPSAKPVRATGRASRGRRGRVEGGDHELHAAPAASVSGETVDALPGDADPNHRILAEIREMHKRRQAWHKAEKSLTLQTKAIERRLRPAKDSDSSETLLPGASSEQQAPSRSVAKRLATQRGDVDPTGADTHGSNVDVTASDDVPTKPPQSGVEATIFYATYPLVAARGVIKTHRLAAERRCQALSKKLPLYAAFVEPVNGFGALGFAQILGECGDLTQYSNPAKLWKRMGVAVISGQRQRRVAGPEALEHGYAPERRSILWNIGDSLLKKKNEYRDVYDKRKLYELEKAASEGLTVAPQATISKLDKNERVKYRSNGHIHARSKRYAEKRLLRNLWRAARKLRRNEQGEGDVEHSSGD